MISCVMFEPRLAVHSHSTSTVVELADGESICTLKTIRRKLIDEESFTVTQDGEDGYVDKVILEIHPVAFWILICSDEGPRT